MIVNFRGQKLPLAQVGRLFIQAWEASEKAHLRKLLFRIPLAYDPPTKSGFVREWDFNPSLTNELVYRILKMPRVGVRKSFIAAKFELMDECFDASGELVSFEPVDQDLVKWAQKKGYYIEFDELEIVSDSWKASQ
jgi:hypothetical protein